MASARHSWIRVAEHCYVCRRCALCRRNERRDGQWLTVWFPPNGGRVQRSQVPVPCEAGALTDKRLAHYASAIAAEAVAS